MTVRNNLLAVLQSGGLRVVLRNFSWITLDRILRMAAGLFVGVWVARYLGPDQYGEFIYFITYISLFATVAAFGLDGIVVRELSGSDANRAEILGTVFVLRAAGGLVGATIGLVFFLLFQQTDTNGSLTLLLVLSLSLLFISCDTFDFWFQSQLQMRNSVIGRNIGFLAATALRIFAILSGLSLIWFAAIYTAEMAIAAGGLLLVYRLSGGQVSRWKFSAGRAVALINQAKFLFITSLLVIVQARIDQVMLANLLGTRELGLYAAALRLIEVFVFLPMMIQAVLVPILSRDEFKDSARHDEKLLNVYRLMVLIFLPIGIPLAIFSPALVKLLYGPEYQAAAPLLALLCIRLLLANFGVAKSLFFLRENAFGISFSGALAGCLTNIALNFVLIPRWGTLGVVWASTISFFVTIFVMDLFFLKTRRNLALMVRGLLTPWRFRIN